MKKAKKPVDRGSKVDQAYLGELGRARTLKEVNQVKRRHIQANPNWEQIARDLFETSLMLTLTLESVYSSGGTDAESRQATLVAEKVSRHYGMDKLELYARLMDKPLPWLSDTGFPDDSPRQKAVSR